MVASSDRRSRALTRRRCPGNGRKPPPPHLPHRLLSSVESSKLKELRPSRLQSAECAPVAQLDRATGYEPVGRAFESLRAHHSKSFKSNQMRRFCLEHLVFSASPM